jgi:hypothetical protein
MLEPPSLGAGPLDGKARHRRASRQLAFCPIFGSGVRRLRETDYQAVFGFLRDAETARHLDRR